MSEEKRVNRKTKQEFARLQEALRQAEAHKVEAAIMSGANVNAKHSDGWTALMQAARYNHAEVVELLIHYGANVNARNKYGNTANLLRSHGAKYNTNFSQEVTQWTTQL